MPKPITKAEFSSFIKGFITEASPLNFPADASKDEENFDINRDGSRDRRLGIDFEDNYQIRDTGLTSANILTAAISSYKWMNAGGTATNEFAVLQFGANLKFFDVSKTSISKDGYIGAVTLTGADATKTLSYASVDGKLIIAAGTDVIHIITYDNSVLAYSTSRLLVRDLWGLPGNDNNDINTRPSVRTDAHIYNLYNQGWGVPRKNSGGTLADPVAMFFSTFAKYPSNTEVVYTGLQYTSGNPPYERIYTNLYDDQLGLDDQSARGYFIIDALKRGTSRKTEFDANKTKFPSLSQTVSSLPLDTTSGGCSVVADFAGRIFYGGFEGNITDGDANSPVLSSYVLFSQVVKNSNDITKCYQKGDPTSRGVSEILDTDGGFIRISGLKRVYGMVPMSSALFVLADNGIWMIQGGNNYGFAATNYSVSKLSSYSCYNSKSIVTVNDQIYFLGVDGIFSISRNNMGDWTVTNISEKTIQKFYDSIEDSDKRAAIGVYDSSDKKIRWIFNQDSNRTNNNDVLELVVDMSVGALSKNKIKAISGSSPDVVGYILTASFLSGETINNIVIGSNQVLASGENVILTNVTRSSGLQSIKYLVLFGTVGSNVGFTFAQFKNTQFRDWYSADGVGADAKAYILTGPTTVGDSSLEKQIPCVTVHFKRTEDGVTNVGGALYPNKESSCMLRAQWNWADTPKSNQWSPLRQAYRYRKARFIESELDDFDTGFSVVTSKNKLRGMGKSVSVYFETEPDKDCRIIGWNTGFTGNSLP